MSQHDKLAKVREKYGVKENTDKLPEEDMTLGDILRLTGAGTLMGFGDELEAGFKSIFPGSGTYEEELKISQKKLKEARDKDEYSLLEMGTAMVPALATAPFTGGASIPLTMARLGLIGAGQGAITALGEGADPNLVNRVLADPYAIPTGAAIGGGGSIVGGKLVAGLGKVISKIADKPVRKFNDETGKRVEDEIIRVMKSQQMPLEEVISGIKSGKILAEISNEFADYVSVLGAKGEDAGAFLKKRIRLRTAQKVKDVYESAQKDLTPKGASVKAKIDPKTGKILIKGVDPQTGNVLKYFNRTIDDIKKEESAKYKELFVSTKDMDLKEAGDALLEIVDGRDDLYKILNKHIGLAVKSKGNKAPLFEMGDDGILKIGRNVNPEVLEEVRRKLAGLTNVAYKSNDATQAGAGPIYDSLEKSVRALSDNSNDIIKTIRANYSKIFKAKEVFDLGRKAFSSPDFDTFENMFEQLMLKNPEQLGNFRLGVVTSLRAKMGKPTKARSFIKLLNNIDSQDRKILEELYPNQSIAEIANKIDIAESAKIAERASQKITTTADKLLKAEKIGKNVSTADVANVLAVPVTGVPSPGIMGSLKKIFKAVIPDSNITEAEMLQIARILVSEDPDAVRKALTDREVRNALVRRVSAIRNTIGLGFARGVGTESVKQQGGKNFSIVSDALANEIDPSDYRGDYKVINDLTKTISPKTREKIMKMYADGTIGKIYEDGTEVPGSRYTPQ